MEQHVVAKEADLGMGADALWQAMMHRRDLYVGCQNAEAALDIGKTPPCAS